MEIERAFVIFSGALLRNCHLDPRIVRGRLSFQWATGESDSKWGTAEPEKEGKSG